MLAFLLHATPPVLRGRAARLPLGRRGLVLRVAPRATATTPNARPARAHQSSDDEAASKALERYLAAGLGVVILKPGKDRLFRGGAHTTVYSGAVARAHGTLTGAPDTGAPVVVCDTGMHCVGMGFFNPHSMFRVRLVRRGEADLPWDVKTDIHAALGDAVALRNTLGLPGAGTDVFRVINSDGDRLSGLVVDRFGDVLVVSSSALWCERHREEIEMGLRDVMPDCVQVVWRQNRDRLVQDGLNEVNEPWAASVVDDGESDASGDNGSSDTNCDGDEESKVIIEEMVVSECDIRYAIPQAALRSGQKTGHYADQRENRRFIRDVLHARGEGVRVLDLYCYTGGFTLSALLAHNETHVTAVDTSVGALQMAKRNVELNGVKERVEFVQHDAVKYLRGLGEEEVFDMVIVDPPKFAPNVKMLARALRKYRSLNEAAVARVKRGGLLCTCSCSAAVTRERGVFVEMVREAARSVGRELTLVKMSGAAADHGVIPEMMETEYLTMCLFIVR